MKLLRELLAESKKDKKLKKEKSVDTTPKAELKAKDKQFKERIIPDKKAMRKACSEE